MPLLNDADAVYLGASKADRVYLGGELVWQAPAPPEISIGDQVYGGYYVGDIVVADGGADDGVYAVIFAPSDYQSNLAYKTSNTDTPGADSLTNGAANTAAIAAAGLADHPAGEFCRNYSGGGFTDWYLPSRDELDLVWINRALLSSVGINAGYFSTSTQRPPARYHTQEFAGGARRDSFYKTSACNVRPCRRVLK